MKVCKGYKTELDLNDQQKTWCVKHTGAARFAYNWGLARKIEAYRVTGKSESAIELHRALNALKKGELAWMYEVSKCAPQEALRDLDQAFAHFFRRVKEGKTQAGFPRFKSRKRGLGSFRLTGSIRVWVDRIQLPRLGVLRLKEKGYLPTTGVKILSATISERAGRWFVSVQVEEEIPPPLPAEGEPIGIDLGIHTLATCSDGRQFANPRALTAKTKQLRRWQKRLSRRVRESANREKARQKVAHLHAQAVNIRRDALHKATSAIVEQRPSVIVLEDLHILGMMKNHKLAQAIGDVSMGEFHRLLAYKAQWHGIELLTADRFFPSSKQCSRCGHTKPTLSLGERLFRCEQCGLILDRDWNASLNLKQLATGSSPGSNACGDGEFHSFEKVAVEEAGTKYQIDSVLNG